MEMENASVDEDVGVVKDVMISEFTRAIASCLSSQSDCVSNAQMCQHTVALVKAQAAAVLAQIDLDQCMSQNPLSNTGEAPEVLKSAQKQLATAQRHVILKQRRLEAEDSMVDISSSASTQSLSSSSHLKRTH